MDAVLISNPSAHKVTDASRRVVERALEATFDLELVTTEDRGHAASLAREAVEAGAKAVVAYGGDGTVNEIVNGLRGATGPEVVLGVLPGGGTNVLARNLGYPNDLVGATAHLIDLVERGSVRRMTLGRLLAETPDGAIDRLFCFGAGLGLDAGTVRRVESSGLRPRLGDLAFLYCGFRAFFALRGGDHPGLVVEGDEGPVDAWWATICNDDPFTYFGKRPLRAAPEADPAGGLDLVAGRTAKVTRTLGWLRQTLGKARHVRDEEVLYLRDRQALTIRTRRPVDLQADGEYLGRAGRVVATSIREGLSLWA